MLSGAGGSGGGLMGAIGGFWAAVARRARAAGSTCWRAFSTPTATDRRWTTC